MYGIKYIKLSKPPMRTKQVIESFIEELKHKIMNLNREIPQFKALLHLYTDNPLALEELKGVIRDLEKSRACCLVNLVEANMFLGNANGAGKEPGILDCEN